MTNVRPYDASEIKHFVDSLIRPVAGVCDEEEIMPVETIRSLASYGYLSATFPRKYGGLEWNPVEYGLLTESIARACSSVRTLLTIQTSLIGESLLRFGNERQKEMWLPAIARGDCLGAFALSEPGAGTNPQELAAAYRLEHNRYILTGVKKWISFGHIADFFIVIAKGDGGQMSAFIVERGRQGLTTCPLPAMIGARGTHIAEVSLEEVEIPRENLIAREGSGFSYVANTALDHGRYSVAWSALGIAHEALDVMSGYAKERKQLGGELGQIPSVKALIGDTVTQVHAARSLCLRAGELRKIGDEQALIETTIAKYFASKTAVQAALDAIQVLGANGCISGSPAERLLREAKILEIIEGTSQVQQQLIGDFGLRHYPIID
jgi:alkylation response protein AidB-like acyl-CoA dehydrogenase